MSDWGTGASSKKRAKPMSAEKKPPAIIYNGNCCRCGQFWGIDYDPHTVPGAICADGFVCKNCRSTAKQYAPSPPPTAMQISIEEKYGAKK